MNARANARLKSRVCLGVGARGDGTPLGEAMTDKEIYGIEYMYTDPTESWKYS